MDAATRHPDGTGTIGAGPSSTTPSSAGSSSAATPSGAAIGGDPIGVALIGTGAIAASHARAIAATDGLALRAVASRTLDGAAAFVADGRAPGAEPRTVDDALADPRIRLAVVATPTGTHVELGERVLAAGRHLLLEKPVDTDLIRARELADAAAAAEARGLVAAAVSQFRFDPASEHVHDAVAAGRFGALTSATASVPWWRGQAYYDSAPWRGTVAGDGGALMNQGIHTLDLLLWMLGSPARVTAIARTLAHERIEVEDLLAGILEFPDGAVATLHATTAAYPGLPARLHLMGSAGTAVLEQGAIPYSHVASLDADADRVGPMGLHGARDQTPAALRPEGHERRDATADHSGLARQLADLEGAIRSGRQPRVTVADAVATLEVVDALYRSAREGRPIDLPAATRPRAPRERETA